MIGVGALLVGLAASPTRSRGFDVRRRAPARPGALVATVALGVLLSGVLTGCTFNGGTSSTGDGAAGSDRSTASSSLLSPGGSPAGWPGPGDTGVPTGVTLTKTPGLTVSVPGTVIDGALISGAVTIEAADVVIKNSRIAGRGSGNGVWVRSGSLSLLDSEIVGFENGLVGDNWTALRVEITGMVGDGVKLGSNDFLVDSWIHDLTPADGAHADGVQMQQGVNRAVVEHNSISVFNKAAGTNGNSALFLAPDLGPSTNGPVLITRNWLDGGNFTVFIVAGDNGRYSVSNIAFSDNQFGRHARYGPLRVNVPATISGNVWADTGASIRN
jgi:hypothetical protein